MKASELVNRLQEMISQHGDLDIFVEDWQEQYQQPGSFDSIDVDENDPPAFIVRAGSYLISETGRR